MEIFQLGFYLKDENIMSQKSHFPNVLNNVVHNNSELKTIKKFNWWMDKQNVVNSYNGILAMDCTITIN